MLLERERLGTTGVGNGIAIPHGKLPELKRALRPVRAAGRPVDFDAIDEQPVDLIFLLLAPEGAGADHLKALARVARLLRDKSICEKLRGADQADAIYALLTDTAKATPRSSRGPLSDLPAPSVMVVLGTTIDEFGWARRCCRRQTSWVLVPRSSQD